MTRYVRTSDGYIGKVVDTKVYIKHEWFSIDDIKCFIIRQADTIDELVDLYIDEETKAIFPKYNSNGYVINWRTNLIYSFKGLIKVFHSIKGAIWTKWGLKYVAKMNDKGDLELI